MARSDFSKTDSRVSSRIFQLGGGGGGGPASLASQILYLITTLGKSLTIPFPGVAKARGLVGETRIQ